MQTVLEATYRDGVLVPDRSLGAEKEGKKFKIIVVENQESSAIAEHIEAERPVIPKDSIREFCLKHHIKKLSIFGSYLREDFRPDSDIDFLVEFDPEHIPGLLSIAGMERELSELLEGRRVDLRTAYDLSRYFRDEVVASAEVQYAE